MVGLAIIGALFIGAFVASVTSPWDRWRGVATAVITASGLLWAGHAWGQSEVSISGSTVKVEPGEDAPYVVEFWDLSVNGPRDDGWYEVQIDGLTIPFHFEWQPTGDRVSIAPPDGYLCEPASCEAGGREVQKTRIKLFRSGVGF